MKNTLLLSLLFAFVASTGWAGQAPQILTTDLNNKQVIETPSKLVSFIIVDEDDEIIEVKINGETQEIKPGKTLLIKRKFTFKEGRTIIKVEAKDEEGNVKTKSFLVGYADTSMAEEVKPKKKAKGMQFTVIVGARSEVDDNPTNDFSSPVDVGDLAIEGVIPDSEQPDSKTTYKGTLAMNNGAFNLLIGGVQATYSKEVNSVLNSQVVYFGGGWHTSGDTQFTLNYMWVDVNIGGVNYSVMNTLSPGIKTKTTYDNGVSTHKFYIDYVTKSFADTTKEANGNASFHWNYHSIDKEKLDAYTQVIAYGTASEGTAVSEQSYLTFDWNWDNKWESGFKWDLGLGLGYHNYKNDIPLSTDTALGETRVDMPLTFYNGFGWDFGPVDVIIDYNYKLNISNKSIYVRQITGVGIDGTF